MLIKLKEFLGTKFSVYFYDEEKREEREIECPVDDWENWFTQDKYDVYLAVERRSYDPDSFCKVIAKVFRGNDPIPGYDMLYRTDTWEEINPNSISINIV